MPINRFVLQRVSYHSQSQIRKVGNSVLVVCSFQPPSSSPDGRSVAMLSQDGTIHSSMLLARQLHSRISQLIMLQRYKATDALPGSPLAAD
jgi:hypothetical protein